jgi:hypothetical protein
MIQLITNQYWHNNHPCSVSNTAWEADDSAFYASKITKAPGEWKSSDSPLTPLNDGEDGTYRREFHARDFLMYRPSGGIWVPLRQTRWGWAGAFHASDNGNGTTWRVLPSTIVNPTNHPPIEITHTLPIWSGAVTSVPFPEDAGCP